MAHVTRSIMIDTPVEKVYARARDPRHWADWYVGLSEPRSVTGDGSVGTVVEQSYQMAGQSFPVTNKVIEDHVGPEGAQCKVTMEGPLAGEQVISLVPSNGGTRMTIDMEYIVPGSVFGKIADKLIIEHMTGNATEMTLKNLKFLCEAETKETSRAT